MNPDRKVEKMVQRIIEEQDRVMDLLARGPDTPQVKVSLSRKQRDDIAKLCHKLTRDIRYYQVEGELNGEKVEVILRFT